MLLTNDIIAANKYITAVMKVIASIFLYPPFVEYIHIIYTFNQKVNSNLIKK